MDKKKEMQLVIEMREDAVRIYHLSESEYLKMSGSDPENRMKKYSMVNPIPKNEFSSGLIKGDARKVKFYYYDNGFSMERKNIDDVSEIEYYLADGKLWPSREYFLHKVKKAPKIVPLNKELTENDYILDNSVHVMQLFQGEELDDFKEYYSKQNNNSSDILKGKLYHVNTYIKLILNNAKMGKGKLTADKLKSCSCLIVTPIGKTRTGDIKYSINEFLLEKYVDKIKSEFVKIKNRNNLKVDEMSDSERFNFLEDACINIIDSVQTEILSRTNDLVFNSKGVTWQEFNDNFLIQHSFSLSPIDLSKWKVYKETILDSRTVHNGSIIPLVEENALQKSSSKKKIKSAQRMSSSELLETQKEYDDNRRIEKEREYPKETYTVDKKSLIDRLLKIDSSHKPKYKIPDIYKTDIISEPEKINIDSSNDTYLEDYNDEFDAGFMVPGLKYDTPLAPIENEYSFADAFQDISEEDDEYSKLSDEEKRFFDIGLGSSVKKYKRR